MYECAGNHKAALHAAGELHRSAVHLVAQSEVVQKFLCTRDCHMAGNAVVAGLIGDNINGLLERIEIDFLPDKSDECLRHFRLFVYIVTEDFDRAARLVDKSCGNADYRRSLRSRYR